FALVLITLGVGFRYLAENSLLHALDREIQVQADRVQESQRIEMIVIGNTMPKADLMLHVLPPPFGAGVMMSATKTEAHYRLVTRQGAALPDKTGEFLYRSFDLAGKPLPPALSKALFAFSPMNRGETTQETKPSEEIRPWDRVTFVEAV